MFIAMPVLVPDVVSAVVAVAAAGGNSPSKAWNLSE